MQGRGLGVTVCPPPPWLVSISSCPVHFSHALLPSITHLLTAPLHIFLSSVSSCSHFPFVPRHVLQPASSSSHPLACTWVSILPLQKGFQISHNILANFSKHYFYLLLLPVPSSFHTHTSLPGPPSGVAHYLISQEQAAHLHPFTNNTCQS